MRSENILTSDLLDIVFENRNKAYGAYELRKHYKRRLLKALSAAFILAGGIACMIFFIKKEKGIKMTIDDTEYAVLASVDIPKEKPAAPKTPQAPKTPVAPKVPQQKHVANIIVTTDPFQATKITNLTDDLPIGGQDIAGDTKSHVVVPAPTKIDAGGNDVPVAPKADKETPRLAADIMPAYPGGVAALRKFMERNLQSFDDIETGKVVSVKVTFIVGYDGKLKGFQILEDGGDMYNKEVIRVLKKMPEWIPGKANGENVSVYYTIPVKFTSAE
ncbi:MAG: energy transducer TonB [Rhizobacter sp.]|nr:energy transducer TonB [Ferruginibacter sp.]